MKQQVGGVVLAGGLGRRMGSEPKVLLRLGGATLVERAVARAEPQVDLICISSDLDERALGCSRCAVLADRFPGYLGPLAGVHAAMAFFRETAPEMEWLCSFAADTPWFPHDLVARLRDAVSTSAGNAMAIARSGERPHPVFALWPMSVLPHLESVLAAGSDRGVARFQAAFGPVYVDWPAGPEDPFFNLNTPEDLARARERMG